MLIKIILNEFAFKNIKRWAGNSFLWKYVPFSYCHGKKENLKISLCPFGTINLKSWLPRVLLFSVCYQIIPPVPI